MQILNYTLGQNVLIVVCVLLFVIHPGTVMADSDDLLHEKIKVAYLYNFFRYLYWPAENDTLSGSQWRLCVVGNNTLSKMIDSIEGKVVRERKIEVLHHPVFNKKADCHVSFYTPGVHDHFKTLIGIDNSVTVSDMDGFSQMGGAISFITQDNKVRIVINMSGLERTGVRPSAKLLEIAIVNE